MRKVGAEAVLRLDPPRERLERRERDLLLSPADPADEMAVALEARAVPARDPAIDVGVGDNADGLERLEVPVDRGHVDVRMFRPDVTGDVLRRRVMLGLREGLEDDAPLDRHPTTARTDALVDRH